MSATLKTNMKAENPIDEATGKVDLTLVREATAETSQVQPAPKPGTIDMTPYNSLPTKSAKIRAMASDGFTTSQIAKALGIIYQHARNVLKQTPKRPAA